VVVLEWFEELLAHLAFALGTNVRLRNLTYLLFKQLVEVGFELAIGRADRLWGAARGLHQGLDALETLVEFIIDSREIHEASVTHLLVNIRVQPRFRHRTLFHLAHHEF
jgi:hypothetical protein